MYGGIFIQLLSIHCLEIVEYISLFLPNYNSIILQAVLATMERFKTNPATISLIIINIIIFCVEYFTIGNSSDTNWTLGLLRLGALFNPFTLHDEWYRIFSHMFLHGSILHVAMNMYGLFSVGGEVESSAGTKKFLWVYFLSGICSALSSLYFGLFNISVGASGAIFGVFGFALLINIMESRRDKRPLGPILTNFLIFLGINLAIAKSVNADNAGHLGGLAAGVFIGLFTMVTNSRLNAVNVEYLLLCLCIAVYFLLPRYQIHYYNFYQAILAVEGRAKINLAASHNDNDYLKTFKQTNVGWDSALRILNGEKYIPEKLHRDTFKLRHYIKWQKLENDFRIKMIERESFVYLDSVEIATDSSKNYLDLEYFLSYKRSMKDSIPDPEQKQIPPQMIKVLYDKNWKETNSPSFKYFRIGIRDSLQQWQGLVRDFYANGEVQMKGAYKNDKCNGIFIYYSDHHTYTSAGRYENDRSVGKWETFHNNGKLESEIFYDHDYFLKNMWDSTGALLIKNGNGHFVQYYTNGVIKESGDYIDGKKEGYWSGRNKNNEMYFEENFHQGRLVKGRSRSLQGGLFYYDESSFSPLPTGGLPEFKKYLSIAAAKIKTDTSGSVMLSFRVASDGTLADFQIMHSLSRELEEKAKDIVLHGPRWIPAKNHGQESIDGFAFARVDFVK